MWGQVPLGVFFWEKLSLWLTLCLCTVFVFLAIVFIGALLVKGETRVAVESFLRVRAAHQNQAGDQKFQHLYF